MRGSQFSYSFFNGVKVNFACHIGEGDNVIIMMSDETV